LLARRFLWIVVAVIVVALAGALAYRLLAPRLMRAALTPDVSFAESPKSPPAFYNRPDAWLARPGIPSENARWTPEGYAPAPKPAIAVFYVHPTTYLKGDRWNAPIAIEGDPRFRQEVFLKSQASVFNGVGEVWAPKYRQATFGAFLSLGDPNSAQAFALAYTDIASAFDLFIKEIPPTQKIILAGHSQGSLHLVSLLAQKIAGTPIADRIVAAYLIGWPISVETDLPKLGLPPCAASDQTRCIVAFQSYAEPAEIDYIFKPFFSTAGLNGEPRKDTRLVCTNPLTGGLEPEPPVPDDETGEDSTSEGGAQASELETAEIEIDDTLGPAHNLGSLVPLDETYADAVLEPGLVGAKCTERGYLSIGENPPKGLGSYVLPGNNYHVYDYALFWTNLRADAERRTQAALAAKAK